MIRIFNISDHSLINMCCGLHAAAAAAASGLLLRVYYVPATVLSTLHRLSHLILTKAL